MSVAAFLATALFVAAAALGICDGATTRRGSKDAIHGAVAHLGLAPLQAFIGDAHGLNTLKYQPAKLAAIEGHWQNEPGEGMPLFLFGLPDMDAEDTQ